jgi:hypothetical protein
MGDADGHLLRLRLAKRGLFCGRQLKHVWHRAEADPLIEGNGRQHAHSPVNHAREHDVPVAVAAAVPRHSRLKTPRHRLSPYLSLSSAGDHCSGLKLAADCDRRRGKEKAGAFLNCRCRVQALPGHPVRRVRPSGPLTAGSFPSSVGSVSVISTDHVGRAALAPLGLVGINLPVDRIYADDIAAGVFQTVAIGRAASQANGQ